MVMAKNVLHVGKDAAVSTAQVVGELKVSQMTNWRVLNEQFLYRHHLQHVQDLLPHDFPEHGSLCRFFSN